MAFLLPLAGEVAGAGAATAGTAAVAEGAAATTATSAAGAATAGEGGSAALSASQFGARAATASQGAARAGAIEETGGPTQMLNKYMPMGIKLPDPIKEVQSAYNAVTDPTNSITSLDSSGITGNVRNLSKQQFGG